MTASLGSMPLTLPIEHVVHAADASEKIATQTLFLVTAGGIFLLCAGIVACVWRILKGPTLVDRGIAGDTLAIHVVALVILVTIRFGSLVLFDAVLIVSILGFVSTVATAQYIARRGAAA